jgi:hypothetical protein
MDLLQLAKAIVARRSEATIARNYRVGIGEWRPRPKFCHDNVHVWVSRSPQHKHVKGSRRTPLDADDHHRIAASTGSVWRSLPAVVDLRRLVQHGFDDVFLRCSLIRNHPNGRRVSVHWFAGVLQSLCSPSFGIHVNSLRRRCTRMTDTDDGRLARSAAPTGAGCRRRSDRAGLVGARVAQGPYGR